MEAVTDLSGDIEGEGVLELVTEGVLMLIVAGRDAIAGLASTTGGGTEVVGVESWSEGYSGCEVATLWLVVLLTWPVL